MKRKKKPTIEAIEKLLNSEEDDPIEILPNGQIRAIKGGKKRKKDPNILTMKENLGGEYGVAA